MDGIDTLDGSNKAFSSDDLGKYDVNNCHDFGRLMGGLNSPHFKSSAKGFWTYYHALVVAAAAPLTQMSSELHTAPRSRSVVVA